jgi:regulator of replication initiation timing
MGKTRQELIDENEGLYQENSDLKDALRDVIDRASELIEDSDDDDNDEE